MTSEKSQSTEGKPTLVVEGKAPLDVLLDLLGTTQKEFCWRVGIDSSTYRRWKTGKNPPNMTLEQAKKLDSELRRVGLTIQDLPNALTPAVKNA